MRPQDEHARTFQEQKKRARLEVLQVWTCSGLPAAPSAAEEEEQRIQHLLLQSCSSSLICRGGDVERLHLLLHSSRFQRKTFPRP